MASCQCRSVQGPRVLPAGPPHGQSHVARGGGAGGARWEGRDKKGTVRTPSGGELPELCPLRGQDLGLLAILHPFLRPEQESGHAGGGGAGWGGSFLGSWAETSGRKEVTGLGVPGCQIVGLLGPHPEHRDVTTSPALQMRDAGGARARGVSLPWSPRHPSGRQD